MTDKMVAFGAVCTWWDSKDKVGTARGLSIPCCPHCRNVLFEMKEEEYISSAREYDAKKSPGYLAVIEWGRGRCYRNFQSLKRAYENREEAKS